MKKKKSVIIAAVILASAAFSAGFTISASSGTPDEAAESPAQVALDEMVLSNPTLVPSTDNDSTITQESISAAERANESYRRVRRLQYEDGPRDDLYNAAYQCFLDNLEVLEESNPDSDNWRPCRSRLLDINPLLEEAAFYYSSKNDSDNLTRFAQAYIDTQLLDAFKEENFKRGTSYPLIVYIAASGAYNSGDFNRAIKYFREYLNTGEQSRREQIYLFLGQAALNSGNYGIGANALVNAVDLYPQNENILRLAIQNCVEGRQLTYLQKLLDRALLMRPNDEQLLTLQGALYQREQQYDKALNIYNRLSDLKPQSLNVAKETAICYYNLGATYYNQAIREEGEKEARRYKRQANTYFDSAIMKLNEVLANDPLAAKYLRALALCYSCIDDTDGFDSANQRLVALGEQPVSPGGMPSLMAVGNDPIASTASNEGIDIPVYSEFATQYVNPKMQSWLAKGEYETEGQYSDRATADNIRKEFDRLNKEAQKAYLDKYAGNLFVQDLRIDKPYDTEHQVYQIESSFGPIMLNVPLDNHEAELFRSNFGAMKIRNPKFHIKDDRVRVASLTFVTPEGKIYESAPDLAYAPPSNIEFDVNLFRPEKKKDGNTPEGSTIHITMQSDVDTDIPSTGKVNDNTIALIVANENYKNVAAVESARHDGDTFREYCEKTLGIPAHNILYYPDASLADLITANDYLGDLVNARDGDADVIVYYSGHGMPDENTKEAYIVPVDATDRGPSAWYSLNKFYKGLADLNARSVMVFVDACFSGSKRDGDILMKTRGIAIKPVETQPAGNMYILTATSNNETAMPYRDKNHGMFTYFLLKKLQESKGNVTLSDLSDYVIDNVKKESLRVNHKLQTPTVSSNGSISSNLKSKKLVP